MNGNTLQAMAQAIGETDLWFGARYSGSADEEPASAATRILTNAVTLRDKDLSVKWKAMAVAAYVAIENVAKLKDEQCSDR